MENINNPGATTAYPPPPQHSHATTTSTTTNPVSTAAPAAAGTTAHTVNDGSSGAHAADALGDKVKGGWNVFHGAGEGIRGNVNGFLDNIGEQIAGRGGNAERPTTGLGSGERPAHVAATGADEIQGGMAELRK